MKNESKNDLMLGLGIVGLLGGLGFAAWAIAQAVAQSRAEVEPDMSEANDVGAEESAAPATGAPVYFNKGIDGVQLHPALRAALDWWRQNGSFPIRVVSTGRTDAQQAELFAKGRDAAGNVIDKSQVVTYASDTQKSAHGFRDYNGFRVACAIDVYPAPGAQGIVLNTADPRWAAMIEAFEALGLVSGSRWTKLRDFPHVETADWKSLRWVG
jgi:hypothetical protein